MESVHRGQAQRAAFAVFALGVLTTAGAWLFEAAGIKPCDLCLEQRLAYYYALPLAAIAVVAAARAPKWVLVGLLGVIALAFLANAGLAVYHSGVEWKLWQGPTACTGSMDGPLKAADLLKQLQNTRVVRCDEVQLRILGLSLANFNVFISAALAALAGIGAVQAAKAR
jgi:disulfide bond formation protein DsbB